MCGIVQASGQEGLSSSLGQLAYSPDSLQTPSLQEHTDLHIRVHTCTHTHTPLSSFPHGFGSFSYLPPWSSQMILTEFLLNFTSHVPPCEWLELSHPSQDSLLPAEAQNEAWTSGRGHGWESARSHSHRLQLASPPAPSSPLLLHNSLPAPRFSSP